MDDVHLRVEGWAYRQDQLPSTHPIAADIPDLEAVEVDFDGITYAKGASRTQAARGLGRARRLPRRRGKYFAEYAFGNATSRICSPSSRTATGRDLAAGRGSGSRRPASTRSGPRRPRRQRAASPRSAWSRRQRPWYPALRPHRMAIGLFSQTDRRLTRTEVDSRPTPLGLHRGARPHRAAPGPTSCWSTTTTSPTRRARSTPHSLRTPVALLGGHLLAARPLVWAARWDMSRDAEIAARDYVRLVLGGVDSVRDISVVQSLAPPGNTSSTPLRGGRRGARRACP